MSSNSSGLNWEKLTFGKYSMGVILAAVKDKEWQSLRESLKGKSLEEKYASLEAYLKKYPKSELVKIRITNYVNALRRGGLVPKSKK